MRQLVEAMLEDLCTRDAFLFRIACAGCGEVYGNRSICFTKAGAPADTPAQKAIQDALYEQERRTARQLAIGIAAEQMNYCPICKRLVCNRCFLICEELDICADCAATLKLRGQPVTPNVVEAVV